MGPELVELVAPVIAIISFGTMILIGMKLRYSHLQRTRLGSGTQEGAERLADAVDALRDEVRLMRDEFVELNARVEFTERLLERPRPASSDPDNRPGQSG